MTGFVTQPENNDDAERNCKCNNYFNETFIFLPLHIEVFFQLPVMYTRLKNESIVFSQFRGGISTK